MEPTFYNGDLLVVKGIQNQGDIKLQDVIVFHDPYNKNMLIIHRVVQIIPNSPSEFMTKGDNNPTTDPWTVQETDVVFIVASKVPAPLGLLIMFIESPIVTIFSVAIVVIVIGVDLFTTKDKKMAK